MINLNDVINDTVTSKGLTEELIKSALEDSLKAAYKKKYGDDTNAIVDFTSDNSEITLYAKKTIVSEVKDPVNEISLEEARNYESECEVGDQILIEFKAEDFTRNEIAVAGQRLRQKIREYESDSLSSEFKKKIGEIVIGYYLRGVNKDIILDLGRAEGIFPRRFQSPREVYRTGDRIKVIVHDVKKNGDGLEVILSRSHPEFVKKIFELEVPEIYEGTVEIVKIVREPGYRTKIAVRTLNSDTDPIGACVGSKGVRINNVMLELEGERIDVLKYDSDPLTFIKNSLSPAEVKQVVVLDQQKRSTLAIVDDDKLSIAIGKMGLNVRLANRLTDWIINVKTISQYQEMIKSGEIKKELIDIFTHSEVEEVNISRVNEIQSLDDGLIKKLEQNSVVYIEDLIKLSNTDLKDMGFTEEETKKLRTELRETLELTDPDSDTEVEEATTSAKTQSEKILEEDGGPEQSTLSNEDQNKDLNGHADGTITDNAQQDSVVVDNVASSSRLVENENANSIDDTKLIETIPTETNEIASKTASKTASGVSSGVSSETTSEISSETEDEAIDISQLPLSESIITKLRALNIHSVELLAQLYSESEVENIDGLLEQEAQEIIRVIEENVDFE